MSYLRQVTNDKLLWLESANEDIKSPIRFVNSDNEPITASLTKTEVAMLAVKLQQHYFALTGRLLLFREASTLRTRQVEFMDSDGVSLNEIAREVVEAKDLGWGLDEAIKRLWEAVR